jgi:gliding motility-associated lipoprotein GldH
MKNAEWTQENILAFEIDSASLRPGRKYDVSLEITNNVNYKYRNIWLFIRTNFSYDSVYVDLNKEYELADEFGKWYGSGFGSLFQSSFPLFEDVVFESGKSYTIGIQQGMRDEQLEGIEKVGIKVSLAQRR